MYAMERRTLHTLELIVAFSGQTVLLAAAWGFLGAIFAYDPIVVSDHLAGLMSLWPSQTTWIVTLVATILSVSTTTLLSIAFKEALRHRMKESISLIHLSAGVALARGSFFVNIRHLVPTLVTLIVFGVTRLLVSSWSALLTPTRVPWFVNASGWELDLTSNWFESTLQQELVQAGVALVRGNSTQIISLDGVLSGIAAAESSLGKPGIFDFNGVKYNVSTGGILPAAPGYGGITDPVSDNNTGLAFAGGRVPTNLHVDFRGGRTRQGLQRGFTLMQQGLTANVTCSRVNNTAGALNLSSSVNPMPVPGADGAIAYWLWAWNITVGCNEGVPSRQQYVTRSNSSTVPLGSSGLISSLVCPYPLLQTGFSWERFTVITNASWRYNFLPLTVCTIDPQVTSSLVKYGSNGAINATVISAQPLTSSNSNLTQFLAAIVEYQSRTTQGLTTNSIGDALYSIYISTSDNRSTGPGDVTDSLIHELEQYWRGVVEFTGTFLRSAFSVDPRTIPLNAQIPVTGNETITTMGWYPRTAIWAYTALPITVVAFMLYAAVAYTLWQVLKELGHEGFTTFDPSNPIHVMMVSSARDESAKDNLGEELHGFESGGVGHNENVMVKLMPAPPGLEGGSNRQRFQVTRRGLE